VADEIQLTKSAYVVEGMPNNTSRAPSSVHLLTVSTHQTRQFLLRTTQTADKVTK